MAEDALYRELPDSFDARVPAPTPWPSRHNWLLSLNTFIWLTLTAAFLLFVAPKFAVVFEQVKVPVPSVTRIVLGLSREAATHLWLMGILLAIVCWGFGRLRGRWASLASTLIPIAAIATWGWMVVTLFLPLIGELEGIGYKRC